MWKSVRATGIMFPEAIGRKVSGRNREDLKKIDGTLSLDHGLT